MSPRLQQLRTRFKNWIWPNPVTMSAVLADAGVSEKARQAEDSKLRRLLSRSMDVIEGLEFRANNAELSHRQDSDLHMEIMSELEEAAALADGAPWRTNGAPTSYAGRQLIAARDAVKAEAKRESKALALRETVYGQQELELALEDRGWKRLIAQSQYEFSRFGIQSIILICRLYWIKNPLARRGVDVSAFYVFGRGLEISSTDEAAHPILNDFFGDPRNASQFSHTALVKSEKKTYTDGNVFWAYFSDPQDGRLECRGLDAIEISDIITDPQDADTPWFYRRDWTEQRFDTKAGRRDPVPQTAWYFALGYEDMPNFPVNQRQIDGYPVMVDDAGQPIPVMHLKDGELPGWRFGCPRMYPAVDWLRAYRHVLEDLCTTWRALARFAWNVETKGGAPAIAALKQTFATTLANNLTQIETNPPPVTGSAFISGPTNQMKPMQTGGATTMNPDNARRVLLMVCSAFGLNENMMGDASTGSLATAQSLERTVELMFLERQEVWREVLQRQGQYALSRSLKAPKGKLREAVAKQWGIHPSEVKPEMVLIETTPRKVAGAISIKLSERKEGRAVISPGERAASQDPIKADLSEAGRTQKEQQNQKITIDVKFPDILEGGIGERIKAISEALTLDGKEPIGVDEKTGIGLLLSELGVENVQEVLEAMYPAATYDPDRTNQPELPTQVRATVQGDPSNPDDEPGTKDDTANPEPDAVPTKGKKGKKAKESGVSQEPAVIDKAVRQLIEAARRNLEARKRMVA